MFCSGHYHVIIVVLFHYADMTLQRMNTGPHRQGCPLEYLPTVLKLTKTQNVKDANQTIRIRVFRIC